MKNINILVKQLSEVAQERKELEVKEKALKEALIEELHETGKDFADTEYGKATIARRSYYKYSEVIDKLEAEVKIKKVEEVEKGIAEESVTEYILFKEPMIVKW